MSDSDADEEQINAAGDARARRLAKKHGHGLTKSRRGLSWNNQGGYQLVELRRNLIVDGEKYDL
jgi:hypothetical protein